MNVAEEITHLRRELRAVIEVPRIRIGPKWVEHSATHPDCYDCIFPAVPAGVTIVGFEYEHDPVNVELRIEGNGADVNFIMPRQAMSLCTNFKPH